MRYIGIDLAWGQKNTTAAVALEGVADDPAKGAQVVAMADALLTNDDIIAWVKTQMPSGEGAIVAIDAPTVVPNETGRRPCEAILSRCMARYQAGPHPANRRLVGAPDGTVRGEVLVARLADECGITHTPYLDALKAVNAPVRAAFEAFPHPAHIALFSLDKTLKYKAKPNRTLESRLAEFRRYTDLLHNLSSADPPLLPPEKEAPWWKRDIGGLTPALLKRHEDALDALTCAYIALYHFRWGTDRNAILGDLTQGYIVTPATPSMKTCFAESGTVAS